MLYFVGVSSFIIQICSSAERLQSWSYLNMHCRDNENKPVDWWYIYKPPTATEFSTDGLNFTYLIPGKRGFTASSKHIDGNSMLQHTLAPFYMAKYKNYMAMVSYYNKDMKRSSHEAGVQAHGIMMADEKGGIWIGHTVPNLLDLKGIRNQFPRQEINSGHLLTCLSLDIATLNLIADLVKETNPSVMAMNIPANVRKYLPGWLDLKKVLVPDKLDLRRFANTIPVLPFEFLTRDKTAHVMVLVRRPGDSRCLYKTFAMYRNVIMDVYQHDGNVQPFCEANYGIRNIESISLKYNDGDVYYVNNHTDKSNFAVNTAAVWQKVPGKNKNQFWLCTSNIEKKDVGSMGGIAICVESYSVWWAFTNFKVREPSCPVVEVVT